MKTLISDDEPERPKIGVQRATLYFADGTTTSGNASHFIFERLPEPARDPFRTTAYVGEPIPEIEA